VCATGVTRAHPTHPRQREDAKTVLYASAPFSRARRYFNRHVVPLCACAGNERRLYLPAGLLNLKDDVPSYLDGSLAGDYGFDPLKLGEEGKIDKYRIAEVIHARWAMLAIPGILIPEALGVPGGVWTETGKVFLEGNAGRPDFLQNPILFAVIQIGLFIGVEGYRSGKVIDPSKPITLNPEP